MNPDRWQQVSQLYHAALAQRAEERAVFLLNACEGDDALRREVESLLGHEGSGEGFLMPALDMTARATAESSGLLLAGQRIGPYQILSPLGSGGNGEVYRAKDTRLGRQVAIKILARGFGGDPDRLARLQREARVLAALHHPHIGGIYGLEESDGIHALVLELVEGPTLAERLVKGPLTVSESLEIARQIADALDAAHEKRIIHRDLKPANIKIAADGTVKVLDFGLAKAVTEDHAEPALSQSPTITVNRTLEGAIVGTPAYMSPEQARGQTVDKRTDIWAFGCVLYELLVGHRAFAGASVSDTIMAVLRDEPEWGALPSQTPPSVRALLRRCLTKDSKQRLRDIGDARIELDQLDNSYGDQRREAGPPRHLRNGAALAVVTVLASATVVVMRPGMLDRQTPVLGSDLSAYKFTPISRDEALETDPAWSPDGKSIAYTANLHGLAQVFTRELGGPDAAQLTRSAQSATSPIWSPDGSRIYYLSNDTLWAVGALGGRPEQVLERVNSAVIHPDGKTFAFARDRKLWVGLRDGEELHEFGQPPFSYAEGGQLVGFSRDGSKLAVLQTGNLWILAYPSGAAQKVALEVALEAGWMPDSRRLVFVSRTSGNDTLSVVDTVDGANHVILRSRDSIRRPSVSQDGKRIAYRAGTIEWNLVEVGLRDGRVRTMLGGGGTSWYPDWAPSGTHYLFATNRSGSWRIEDTSANEGFSKLIAEADSNDTTLGEFRQPRWAPDGRRFVFVRSSSAGGMLMLANASSGRAVPLDPDTTQATGNPAWSPDGQWIAYFRTQRAARTNQIVKTRPGSTGAAEILRTFAAGSPSMSRMPVAWSPTGDWILVQDGQAGTLLLSPDGKTERRLTTRVGAMNFSKDGRDVHLIYQNSSGQGAEWQLYSLDVATGTEKLLADVDFPVTTAYIMGFSPHPDGTHFATSIAKWPYDIWMLEGFDGQ